MRDFHAGLPLWLRSFERIAATGSMGRAAEALFLTPSALSQHIRNLENELGVTLFVRERGRGLRLTPAGEALAHPARRILETLGGLREEMAPYAAVAPVVRFGVLPGLFERALESVRLFREKYPHIAVSLHSLPSMAGRASLLNGELDLAVIFQQSAASPLQWEALFRSPLVLVLPARTRAPARMRTLDDLKLLREGPLAAVTSGRDSPGYEVFLRAGFPVESMLHLDSSLHAVEVVRSGAGAAIVAEASLPAQREGLRVYPLGSDFPANEVGLVRLENHRPVPGEEEFSAFSRAFWRGTGASTCANPAARITGARQQRSKS